MCKTKQDNFALEHDITEKIMEIYELKNENIELKEEIKLLRSIIDITEKYFPKPHRKNRG